MTCNIKQWRSVKYSRGIEWGFEYHTIVILRGDVSDTQMVEISSYVPPIGVFLCHESRIRDLELTIVFVCNHHLHTHPSPPRHSPGREK